MGNLSEQVMLLLGAPVLPSGNPTLWGSFSFYDKLAAFGIIAVLWSVVWFIMTMEEEDRIRDGG